MKEHDHFSASLKDDFEDVFDSPKLKSTYSEYALFVYNHQPHLIFYSKADKEYVVKNIRSYLLNIFSTVEEGRACACYNPFMYSFLTAKEYVVTIKSGVKIILDGKRFLADYANGFRRGLAYFVENFSITTKESLQRHLNEWYNLASGSDRFHYNEEQDRNVFELTGYYSALVWAVFNLHYKHPTLFVWAKEVKSNFWEMYLPHDTILNVAAVQHNTIFYGAAIENPSSTKLQTIDGSLNTNYETFDQLFKNPDEAGFLIGLLRRIEPPLISDVNEWVGRRKTKTAFVAWIEVLEEKGKIHSISNRKTLVSLANAKFPKLNLGKDASVFRDLDQLTLKSQYQQDFLALISST